MKLDIHANRRQRKYSFAENARRVVWAACWPLFRFSPRPFHGWRIMLLRMLGARIGRDVQIHPGVQIFLPSQLEIGDTSAVGDGAILYNLGPLSIGVGVTISQRAHLCGGSHDHRDPTLPLQREPVHIGDQAWICAEAFVGPGVTVGEGAVVGARAVAVRDVPAWAIVVGNPARVVGQRTLEPAAGSAP